MVGIFSVLLEKCETTRLSQLKHIQYVQSVSYSVEELAFLTKYYITMRTNIRVPRAIGFNVSTFGWYFYSSGNALQPTMVNDGTSTIWMAGLLCSGIESRLVNCRQLDSVIQNCRSYHTVGVSCSLNCPSAGKFLHEHLWWSYVFLGILKLNMNLLKMKYSVFH